MVANIPGPITLNKSNYYSDPLIRAVFKGKDKIEDLLTMTHRKTTEFGVKREGQMVIKDASLNSITFAEHKIVVLSTTLESARKKLETLCFEIILEAISKELAAKRIDLSELREHRQIGNSGLIDESTAIHIKELQNNIIRQVTHPIATGQYYLIN